MDPKRWERIKKIFGEARTLEPARRKDYLIEACGSDDSLLRETEALINSLEESKNFLEMPPESGLLADGSDGNPGVQADRAVSSQADHLFRRKER